MVDTSYAGDVTPKEAWEMLESESDAILIDVRTPVEWSYVGRPVLDSIRKETKLVPWQVAPGAGVNPQFLHDVLALGTGTDAPLLLLCRSGVRSVHAAEALTGAGFSRCYNVADGFEGGHDSEGHRGRLAGWKASGLPWVQD